MPEESFVAVVEQEDNLRGVPTTPLRQWGFRRCLPFSWTTLRGKHCRQPITLMGVVDTFRNRRTLFFAMGNQILSSLLRVGFNLKSQGNCARSVKVKEFTYNFTKT